MAYFVGIRLNYLKTVLSEIETKMYAMVEFQTVWIISIPKSIALLPSEINKHQQYGAHADERGIRWLKTAEPTSCKVMQTV